ncbi:NAD-dependent epimerase/dehydratase family protein [Oceaniglobus roseus]|uniref:NAD-dependent epimerase/dehydratase family protein n=1 Tax=Oceaniglobus roseus TaxID=1737570 RepID=UPI001300126E|nr:NAD(P)-dependent oxidoreductase [Kandeliimicrobium roseum]
MPSLLRAAFGRFPELGEAPLAVARTASADICLRWDMDRPPPPRPRLLAPDGVSVFSFAGVTPRSGAPLGHNTALALAALEAAREWGAARLFVMSSSSVYGATDMAGARENARLHPAGDYGAAKVAMETALRDAAAVPGAPPVTILRLGNVAGAGQPFDAAAAAGTRPLTPDRFPDGPGPSRSFVGPLTLAHCFARLSDLVAAEEELPPVLNVAAPRPTTMSAILSVLGVPFAWAPAPQTALHRVHLDTRALMRLVPDIDPQDGDAAALVREVRAVTSEMRHDA